MSSAAEELSPAAAPSNAVSDVAELPPLSEEQSHVAIEKVWRFFCSLRLTLFNLVALFLGMIAGTFVNPQNDSLASIERAFAGREWTLRAYRGFELYDLFHSWWFTGLLVSLALNLIACSLERLPRIWFLVRYPQRRLDHVVGLRFKVPATASDRGEADIAALLRRRGYRVEVPQQGFVFAERGRYARFGVWVVHLSLLLILGGGVFGRVTAFEGVAQVPQNGGIISGFIQRTPDGSEFKHPLIDADTGRPFLVQCNDFRLKEFEPGRPKAFESDLVVFEDLGSGERGKELARATIRVNHPLRYGGLTFYQASFSQLDHGQRAKLAMRDRQTGETLPLMLAAGEPVQPAEGLTYRVVEYSPDFAGLGPAVQVVRSENGKRSAFRVFAKDPGFDARNRSDRFSFSFERLAPLYATGLQIARDPSTPVVYAGCFLLFAGIGIAFYTSHKRIWVQAAAGQVALGGASHRNAEAFAREFGEIRAELYRERQA